jgi:hypothetical protein
VTSPGSQTATASATTATPDVIAPSVPTSLTATPQRYNKVALSW